MPEYDAGKAVAIYDLTITTFEAKIQRAVMLYGQLEAAQQRATRPTALPAPAATPGGGGNLPDLSAGQARAALTAQRLATEQQRTAQAAQRMATEEQKTAAATAKVDAAQSRAAKAALSLEQAQEKAAHGGSSLAGSAGSLQSLLGGLGIVIGTKQVLDFTVASGKAALELDHTERVTKEIAGSTQVYAQIVAAARQQQILFGGSLQENLDGLSGLAVTSKNTGASLSQLIDLQKRLTVLNPAQGAQGGLIALNEALAGNVASLSRRFNIPRAELQKLNDTALPVAERLKVLDQFLNKVGITSDAVTRSVGEQAQTFNELHAELGDLVTGFGDFATKIADRPAKGLTRFIELLKGSRDAAIQARQAVAGEDAGTARRNVLSNQIDAAIGGAVNARRQALEGEPQVDPLSGFVFHSQEAVQAGKDIAGVLQPLRDRMIEVSTASDANADAVRNAIAQLQAGAIHGSQFAAVLDAIALRERGGADIEDRRAAALTVASQAQRDAIAAGEKLIQQNRDSAQAAAQDTIEKRALTTQTQLLQAQTDQAVDAFFRLHPNIDAAGIAALAAAGKIEGVLNPSLLQAALLASNATSEMIRFRNAANQQATDKTVATNRAFGRASGRGGGSDVAAEGDAFVASLQKQNDAQQRIADAQRALDLARAKTAQQRIAILQKEQAATTDVAEKLRIQAQIEQERNATAKSHTSELDKQLNLNEKIRDSQEQQLKASIDARKLAAQDTLDRLKENREIAQAQRILANPRSSAEFRAAAQARIDLTRANQDERALALRQAQATSGGTIVNGRVFQSLPGGAAQPPPPGLPPQPGAQRAAGGAQPGAAGGANVVTLRLVDGADRIIADSVEPFILADFRAGLARVQAGGTGRAP